MFVLFLLLQAAALGNVLPIETAPAPLPWMNTVLPLTTYVNATSQLVAGGSLGSVLGVATNLLVWGIASSVVALLVVRRRRVVRAPLAAPAELGETPPTAGAVGHGVGRVIARPTPREPPGASVTPAAVPES